MALVVVTLIAGCLWHDQVNIRSPRFVCLQLPSRADCRRTEGSTLVVALLCRSPLSCSSHWASCASSSSQQTGAYTAKYTRIACSCEAAVSGPPDGAFLQPQPSREVLLGREPVASFETEGGRLAVNFSSTYRFALSPQRVRFFSCSLAYFQLRPCAYEVVLSMVSVCRSLRQLL